MANSLLSGLARFTVQLSSPHPAWLAMDRDLRKLLTFLQRFSDPEKQTPQKLRRSYRLSTSLWNIPAEQTVTVSDEQVNDNITLRWYTSSGKNDQGLVFFHGGGMMIGDLQTHDQFCRRVAAKRGMTVIAVNYRLAPENPFPAAAEDAILAWNHISESWLGRKKQLRLLGIGGDSAGGCLASIVCQQFIKPGLSVTPKVMPAWQWLVYPITDCTDRTSESWMMYSHDLLLTNRMVVKFYDHYMPDVTQRSHPEASPALASADVLSKMPATAIVTAEFDPLRDQGVKYARLLKSCGVPVVQKHESKLVHGYISFGGVSSGARMGIEKAIGMIDLLCLQAKRTLPGQVEREEIKAD